MQTSSSLEGRKINDISPTRWLDITIDWEKRLVTRAREPLEIKGLTFDLMRVLLTHSGEVVTLDQLIDAVWQGQPIGNEVVTQRVRMLRRALGDQSTQSRYVETIRGIGYRALGSLDDRSDVAVPQNPGYKNALVLSGVSLAAVAVVAGLWLWVNRSESGPAGELLERAAFYAGLGQSDDALRAISLYRRALDIDPQNSTARLGLSFVLSQRVCQHDDRLALATEARDLAQIELEHNPRNAAAHAALAYANDCLGQVDDALQGYLRAYDLDSDRHESLASAAHLLTVKGRLAEALELNLRAQRSASPRQLRFGEIQVARILDLMGFDNAALARYANTAGLYPENVFAAAALVRFQLTRGRTAEAQAAAVQAEAMNAGSAELYVLQAEMAALQGDTEARDANLRLAADYPTPGSWAVTLKGLYTDGGADAAWVRARAASIESAIANGDKWPTNSLELAVLYARLGEHDFAMTQVSQAIDHGYRDRVYLTHSPWLSELRTQPQFASQLILIQSLVNAEREAAITANWWTSELIRPVLAPPAE